MTPERIARIRHKIDEARAKGASGTTTVDLMVLTIEELEGLLELNSLFDLRWEADMRAIKAWQEAHPGNDLIWPDHVDLVVWLEDRHEKRTSELLANCNRWEQAYRDVKSALAAAVNFAKHAAQALGQEYHP